MWIFVCATQALRERQEDVNWRSRAPEAETRSIEAREHERRARERAAALTRRRDALRVKLASEEARDEEEMAGKRVSAAARRMELEARARELLAKREEERKQHVEEMTYKKWKESNETARDGARAALANEVQMGRQAQVEERRRLAVEHAEREKKINATISALRAEDSARIDERDAALKAAREAHSRALFEQMSSREHDRLASLEERRYERAQLNARWEQENAIDAANQREEALRQRQVHADLLRSNAERQLESLAALEEERACDARLVENAMEEERIHAKEHAELVARRREEEILFRKYLEELTSEKRANKEIDDVAVEEARLEHERKLRAREELEAHQREQLMKDVIDGRRQQIAEAEAKKRAEKEEELAWRRANEEDMELARRQLDEKLRMATEASLRHRAELEAQISERKSRLGDGDVSSAFVDVDVERNERFARRFAEEKQTSKVYSF